ncbi:MAG TPA: cell division protein CrgA [Nocardioidaceae bacterium]|nr:cell division protein CrgA [Nocardioidaceae bacterium]
MPESRSRKKKKSAAQGGAPEAVRPKGSGRWVVPTMCTLLLLGLAWIVVFYLTQGDLPGMRQLGDWNLLVGMGLIMLGLLTAMKWE